MGVAAWAVETPVPAPTAPPVDPATATAGPGVGAFIAFFLLAIALVLLMRDMVPRMQRMSYRAQERDRDQQQGIDDTDEPPTP